MYIKLISGVSVEILSGDCMGVARNTLSHCKTFMYTQ